MMYVFNDGSYHMVERMTAEQLDQLTGPGWTEEAKAEYSADLVNGSLYQIRGTLDPHLQPMQLPYPSPSKLVPAAKTKVVRLLGRSGGDEAISEHDFKRVEALHAEREERRSTYVTALTRAIAQHHEAVQILRETGLDPANNQDARNLAGEVQRHRDVLEQFDAESTEE